MKKQIDYREITWREVASKGQVTITEYLAEMREYGEEKARTVRTARKYLRDLGIKIDSKGRMSLPQK